MFKQKIKVILKKLPKIFAILLFIAVVVYLGFHIFISIYFKPHDVRLTNVTDTSFTVSWVTNYPMKGIVYYKDNGNILPWFFSWFGSKKAYDERDIALAESECVEKFSKEAKVSEDFVVDTSKYNCNEVQVKKVGKYFVHHVTLTDLEANKEYHFRIGDGIFSRKMDMNKSATFLPLSREIETPAPIFGKVVNDKGEYVNDSVVYIKFINGYLQKESMYYSSVTASDGSWYLDGNNIRTIEGEPIIVEDKQDMIKVYAQYQNYTLSDANDWVYGSGDFAYPDIVVSDSWEKDLSMTPTVDNDDYTGWVKRVFASDLTKEQVADGIEKLKTYLKRENITPNISTTSITESVKMYGDRKGFREIFVENTQLWEYVLFGVFVLSFVVLFVFWLKNRKSSIFFRIKKLYGVLQVLLLVVPVIYLGIKVNTVQNLSSEESHAGCHETDSCASWADLVASKAESGDAEDRQWAEERQEQMRKDEELFGSNAPHLNPDKDQKTPYCQKAENKDKPHCGGSSSPQTPTTTGSSGSSGSGSNKPCKYGDLSGCSDDVLKANMNNWGAGNVHAELTRRYNDPVKAACLLNWCNNTTQLAGNLHAATGVGVKADEISSALGCGNNCTKEDLANLSATVTTGDNGKKSFDLGKKETGQGFRDSVGETSCEQKGGSWNGSKCITVQTSSSSDVVTSSATIVKVGDNYYWEVPNSNKKVLLNITAEEARGLCKGESDTDRCDGVQLHYSQVANIGMLYNILSPFQQTKLTDYIKETHNTILGTDNSFYLKEDGVFIKNVDGHLIVTQKNGQPYDGKVTVTEDLKKLFPQLANYDIGEKINIADSLKVLNQIVYSYDDGDKRGDTANSQADLTSTFTETVNEKIERKRKEVFSNAVTCKNGECTNASGKKVEIDQNLKYALNNNWYCKSGDAECLFFQTCNDNGENCTYDMKPTTSISGNVERRNDSYYFKPSFWTGTRMYLLDDDKNIKNLISTQCAGYSRICNVNIHPSMLANLSATVATIGLSDNRLSSSNEEREIIDAYIKDLVNNTTISEEIQILKGSDTYFDYDSANNNVRFRYNYRFGGDTDLSRDYIPNLNREVLTPIEEKFNKFLKDFSDSTDDWYSTYLEGRIQSLSNDLRKLNNECIGGNSENYVDCMGKFSTEEYEKDLCGRKPELEACKTKGVSDSVLGTTDSTTGNTNTLGSGYITYLPEYGFFDMEIEGLKETEKVEGNTLRIFYVETNGVEGFQPPADPDNPKKTEDIMLQSNSLNISYKKSAEVMTLDLKRGVNLVSFNYIPKIENNEYSKASSMLKWLVSKGARVEHISYFSGGRWKGIGYVGGQTTGDDFNITPGKGYLIYTEADATVSIPGYRITSSVPVPLSAGWNLVGIHGYSQMYTARSFIDSINSVEGLTANNVSWWPTSKGKYEGLQVVDGKQYGFDFSLSSSNGYFVKISKYKPKDSKCKSLLWHAGGSHSGACGGSK